MHLHDIGTISFVPVNKAAQNRPNHVGVTFWGSFGQQATTDISGPRNPVQNHQGLLPGCKLVGSISKHNIPEWQLFALLNFRLFRRPDLAASDPTKAICLFPYKT